MSTRNRSGDTLAPPPAPQRDEAALALRGWHQPRLPRGAGWYAAALAVVVASALQAGLGLPLLPSLLTGWAVLGIGLPSLSRAVEGRRKAVDRLVSIMVSSAFVLAMVPLVSILWTVVKNGLPVLSSEFFTYSMRNVVGEGGGIYHAVWGTVLITAAAAVMSVPLGLLTAIFLVEYGGDGRLAKVVRFLVDVMTGIPSIVAGLFAYALFVVFFGPGVRMGIAGAVALTVLMTPVVVRSSEEMLQLVPHELREAAYALGVPRWRTIVKVVLPTSMAGLVTGVTLAVARVIGETAPLLITVGITDSSNFTLFDGRMATLPVFTYSSIMSPGVPPEPSIARAWGAALVLMLIVMVLNLVARLVTYFFSPKGKR
ncbi:phosphate ABC transporter permease PstA [Mumia sp. zg.B53]|uniref:phosphate ABC transporter permease PstA n=1 Tax=unclassified Mumia TaxID=2621872 RepID=UPI001C6F37C1|nr:MULTISPECIES: phosphate ABC transporter permease PstA [unclassified Mumia]MBW9207219.1 phosphate ABC transporter permease PstA [Mumia sp. zg.B17]MBW9215054.1 phosphate ABC transporter permease PstA [Mumia sp. zg.B53]MDD9347942.1 phosphate ABC transporter permease PstA [Mumia sp.]